MQISFFGATNSGKSTLVNALAGQQVSLVSPLPGTTTDPVRKRIELPGLGACILVDTAGYGDEGALGAERERLTRGVIDATDLAVLLRSGHPADDRWVAMLNKAEVPTVIVDRTDGPWTPALTQALLRRMAEAMPKEAERFLTGRLVKPGDQVLLVMPQDSEAPKGRIILPQVQVLRELLDRGCIPHCCTPETLPAALAGLREPPALVITDSQAFRTVNAFLSEEVPLTSFSVLLAGLKGDLRSFILGAEAIDRLQPGDRVLIAEACTHVPDNEDIGRVKIPTLLQKRIKATAPGSEGARAQVAVPGGGRAPAQVTAPGSEGALALSAGAAMGPAGPLTIDSAAGNDFPEDLSPYRLIIHCGACVANAALVRARIRKARLAGVPITNYGIALAHLHGILPRIALP